MGHAMNNSGLGSIRDIRAPVAKHFQSMLPRMNSASGRSAWVVTLMLSSLPSTRQRAQAQPLHRHGFVGDLHPGAQRGLQRAGEAAAAEQLRRQRAPQPVARLGGQAVAEVVGALERVAHRRRQQRAAPDRPGPR